MDGTPICATCQIQLHPTMMKFGYGYRVRYREDPLLRFGLRNGSRVTLRCRDELGSRMENRVAPVCMRRKRYMDVVMPYFSSTHTSSSSHLR